MILLPLIHSGGLYLIENLETNYLARYGSNYLDSWTTIALIKTVVDEIELESPRQNISIVRRVFSFEVGHVYEYMLQMHIFLYIKAPFKIILINMNGKVKEYINNNAY
jgi:hypothetical protein